MARAKQGQPGFLNLKRRLRSDMTGPEQQLWLKLRARQFQGLKFRRQHGIGPYIVDFYCPERSLVLEIDGDSHAGVEQILKDQERDRYLHSLGLHVVRYQNHDVMQNLDGVLEDLLNHIAAGSPSNRTQEDSTSPSPSLRRRGKES
jgi:very-short-patch-repair endonuclease